MKKFRLTAILITLIMCFSAVGANAAAVKEVVPFTDFSTAPALYAAGGVFIKDSTTDFTGGEMVFTSKTWNAPTGIFLKNLDDKYEELKYRNRYANGTNADGSTKYSYYNETYKPLFRKYTHVLSMDITVKSANAAAAKLTDAYMTINGASSSQTNTTSTPNLSTIKSTLLAVGKGDADNTWKLMLNTTQQCYHTGTDGKITYNMTNLKNAEYTVPDGCDKLAYGTPVNVKIVLGHNSGKGHDYMSFYIDNKFYGVKADSSVAATGSYNQGVDERLSYMAGLRFRTAKSTAAGDFVIGIDNLSWLAYEGTYDAALSASADITVTDGTASTTASIITPTAMPNKKTYMAVLAEYDSNGMVRCDMGKVTDAAYENTIPLSLGSADESNRFAAYVMEYDSLKPILATPATLN